jgi:serine/threonine-protein kinase
MADLSGRLIGGRYLIKNLVASGGMATVYLAIDTRLQREVALKIIHPHLSNDQDFREKFMREALIAARLSHPNLVNIFDQGQDGDLAYIAMEYVPGITLRDALREHGSIDSKRGLALFEKLLTGLAAAHRAGILHRDLKPENIFLADDGRIKLGDFGLARDIDNHTSTGSLVGTVAYLSPELVLRGIADARSDVYAAGIILFEMLTGRQPFEGEQAVQIAYQHANSQVPAPSSFNSEIAPIVDELVLWACAKDASHRPADAGELLAAVQRARRDLDNGLTGRRLNATQKLDTTEVISPLASGSGALLANATEVIPDFNSTEKLDDLNATTVLDDFDVATEEVGELAKLGHSRRLLRIAIATLLTVLLGAGAGWWFGAGPGGFKAIPDVANRTSEQASAALESLNAKIQIITESNESVPVGLVIRTEPGAGSLYFGGDIKIVTSTGPAVVKVPKLLGKNLAEATTALVGAGLKLGKVSSWFVDSPLGTVYETSAGTTAELPGGSAVDLKVSLGAIPVVAGLSQDVATAALTAAGLKVAGVSEEFSDTVAKGQVISLVPSSQPLGEGSEVTLKISKGPDLVAVPAVVGETILAAEGALKAAGFNVVVDTDQLSSRWGIVKVKRVSQPAGTLVKSGSTITIYSR